MFVSVTVDSCLTPVKQLTVNSTQLTQAVSSSQNGGVTSQGIDSVGPLSEGPSYPEVWEQIRDRLGNDIVIGRLPPGTRLVEEELASSLGVSRGPVRRALADLEYRGLLEVRARRGARVVKLTAKDVIDLYIAREAIESASLASAEPHNIKALIADISEATDLLEQRHQEFNPTESIRADLRFHRLLVAASANGHLLRLWDYLADQVALTMARVHSISPDESATRGVGVTLGDHRLILDALREEDLSSALGLLHSHLSRARSIAAQEMQGGH